MSHPAQTPVPNAPGTHLDLSDAEEEYNVEKLNAHEIYETKNPKIVARHMASAETIAFHSIDHILDKVAGILQEKYLNSKINGHSIETTHDLVDLLFNTEFIAFDKHKFVDDADEEPVTISLSISKLIL